MRDVRVSVLHRLKIARVEEEVEYLNRRCALYEYVVAAYSIIFGGIFIFTWFMFSRQKQLEKKLNDLREELKDSSKR